MPTISDLLLEKKRYGLKQEISDLELEKIEQGYPIQYIMGYVEYANVRINLNHNVLIPKIWNRRACFYSFKRIFKAKYESVGFMHWFRIYRTGIKKEFKFY
nr:hypothetical protein [Mycoplasmopsis bovis]